MIRNAIPAPDRDEDTSCVEHSPGGPKRQATLTSITINGAPPSITINGATSGTMSVGAFAALTATGHYSDGSTQNNLLVTWSSSLSSVISVSNNGVITALRGWYGPTGPVEITATSGSIVGSVQIGYVFPQTTLFASDGSNLSIYDITFDQGPSSVLAAQLGYYTQIGAGNGQNPIPMALGPGPNSTQQYLFVANPAYLTDNAADFVIAVIDTTTYQVVNTINTGLCYPTSLAVAALDPTPAAATTPGNNYLYVVNAGTSVSQSQTTIPNCTGANVQYYDISQVTNKTWSPAGTLTSSQLEKTSSGVASGVSNAVPLVVAASADQADGLVYVGSTANYSSTGTGIGLLTAIQTGTTTVTSASDLNFSSTAKYAISPLSLTVSTAYPSWSSGAPVHTAFMVGPGYNTFTNPSVAYGTMYYYVSDQCKPSQSCTTQPQCLYCLSGGGGPGSYSPWVSAKSPDGLTIYAGDDTYYLDQLVSTDGTSSTGFFFSNYFTTSGTNVDNCVGVCGPITSVATNADESHVFVGFAGENAQTPQIGQIDTLVPSTLDLATVTTANPLNSFPVLSLMVTQNPEIQLTISQTGLVVTGSFQVNGNFQNPNGPASAANTGGYPFECNWGQGIDWQASLGIGPTGGQITPGTTPTYTAAPSVSIQPYAHADATGNGNSIITTIPVGPITTQITAVSSTVQLGSTDQFSDQVSNATDQTVTWLVNGSNCTVAGSSCPLGTVDASGLYTAPAPSSSAPTTVAISAVPNADTTDQTAVSNVITLTLTTPPTASINPGSLTFAAQDVGTTSAAQKITVTNTGQANLVLAATPITISGADPSDYAIASGTTCTANLSIAPNSNCAIQITFTPSTTGTLTASVVVTDNSGGTSGATQSVNLTGTGQQLIPTASISPTSLTFSVQNVGTTSAAQKVTVTNTGTANLVLGATPTSFTGTDPSDFAIASGTTCTANLAIAPNANCIIEVTFSPTASGTLTANLVITDNSGGTSGTTQTVTLTGTGQQPTPTASVSPSSLTFSVQNVGTTSAAQKVTVTNTGTANLVLAATPVSISGTDPSDYAIASGTTCTANLSIAPNSSCAIQVTFSPSTAGTLTANLVITDNSGGTSGTKQTVTLTGTGLQPTGTANVSPSSLTFATQNVGTTSSPKTVTVTNTGQANLLLGTPAATVTGAASDYAIASGTTCTANLSIAPNSSCVFQITFSPLEAGTLTANLVITDNSGGTAGTTQTVSLTGTGFQPITVAIYPANPAVQAGATQQFTPNFTPSSAAGPVKWSVSGSGCGGQACGSINATGLYAAPATLSAVATDTVTVTLNSNTSVTNSTQVDLYLQPILSTSGASQTVVAGQPATYNLALAPGTGDTATTLMVECHQNTLPTGVTCPPVTVQPSSSGASFTFVIDTTAGQDASLLNRQWGIHLALLLPCCVLISLAGARKATARRKNLLSMVFSLLVVVCLVSFSACGTNGTFGTTTQKTFNGTPSGTYTIEIDGVGPSGVPQSIGTVSLTVQ